MSRIKFIQPGPPLSEADIDAVQARLGVKFPPAMRDLYLIQNGGMPYPDCIKKDNDYFKVNEFLSMMHSESGLEESFRILALDNEGIFPKGLVPFALDGGGDVFCFRSLGERVGSVCCWTHEETNNPIVDLAESFDAFLDALVDCPD